MDMIVYSPRLPPADPAGRPANFATLDIAVIDVPVLRLDLHNDRQRLLDTVDRIRPRLLVLDPLVRLHRVDENAVADIAPILSFLRNLQRRFDTAVDLSITPAKPPPRAPDKLFAGRPSSMHGATATCTCAAGPTRPS